MLCFILLFRTKRMMRNMWIYLFFVINYACSINSPGVTEPPVVDKTNPILRMISNQLERMEKTIGKIQGTSDVNKAKNVQNVQRYETKIELQYKSEDRYAQLTELTKSIKRLQYLHDTMETKMNNLQGKIDDIQNQIVQRVQHTNESVFPPSTTINSGLSKLKNKNAKRSCGPEWIEYQNYCYYFGLKTTTWPNATVQRYLHYPKNMIHTSVIICERKESFLVKIENSEENLWLGSQYRTYNNSYRGFWIGANDLGKEGSWKWVSDNSTFTYSNWYPGEPNVYLGTEDCGLAYLSQSFQWNESDKWNDGPCLDETLGYICKKFINFIEN